MGSPFSFLVKQNLKQLKTIKTIKPIFNYKPHIIVNLKISMGVVLIAKNSDIKVVDTSQPDNSDKDIQKTWKLVTFKAN